MNFINIISFYPLNRLNKTEYLDQKYLELYQYYESESKRFYCNVNLKKRSFKKYLRLSLIY